MCFTYDVICAILDFSPIHLTLPSNYEPIGAELCFKSSSITALDLSRNPHFGNDGLLNFITSYRESNNTFHLKSLCLRNTGLDGMWRDTNGLSGIVSLSHFLSLSLNSITALDLSENHLFGDEGVALFFKNMSKSSALKYLNMSECAIMMRSSSNHIAQYINGNKVGGYAVYVVLGFNNSYSRGLLLLLLLSLILLSLLLLL